MIRKIGLKFGSAPSEDNLKIDITPITIFVGPNNSGKSKILKEINQFCSSGQNEQSNVIIEEIILHKINESLGEKILKHIVIESKENETLPEGYVSIGEKFHNKVMLKSKLNESFERPNERDFLRLFCDLFLSFNTLYLNGEGRMHLTKEKNGGNLQSPPTNSLSTLFRDDEKRSKVRRIIYDAFKMYFVIDPTDLGKFKVKLSDITPKSDLEERGIHSEAIEFHKKAKSIEQLSDGVKAFTGIILEIIAGEPLVLLIDEPEAFLHPSLSFKLGKEVAISASEQKKNVFVSTHSSHFLMGCIQSGVPVNIVRLTYSRNIATARLLSSGNILTLMRNPLMRSTGVINGLFYEAVVVTESDADRAFYQEINDRLLRFSPDMGIANCLFINAQNKQTVHQIIKPLRDIGIPAVAVVDIDILKEGGKVWTNFVSSANIPDILSKSLGTMRQEIKKKFTELNLDMKRGGGVTCLPSEEEEVANTIFDQLNNYGLFVVRNGELESWLTELNATGHGPKWLIETFEKMGENPESAKYLKPKDDDVWQFLAAINAWVTNKNKKGILNQRIEEMPAVNNI
ncbi:MAG: AAA family ATPase [Bacteroidales bacterium]|nr:AAA family ATPase [Bacteroidales bacterium]